jgi:hypothetical protein
MTSDLVLNNEAHNWSDSIVIKAHDKCELTVRNLILEAVCNNWQWMLSHCGVWVLIYSGTPFEMCSYRSRHYIVCIPAGLQTFSTQFLFCEILRFPGDACKTTVLLDTNLPGYGRNLLPPSPNPDDRARMLTRNGGKFLTTIWRHIPRQCNLHAVFCPCFVLCQSCARDTIVSCNCTS